VEIIKITIPTLTPMATFRTAVFRTAALESRPTKLPSGFSGKLNEALQ